MVARNPKSTKVSSSKWKPSGLRINTMRKPAAVTPDKKIYKKSALREDPTAFTGFGFGNTGLTGES